MKPATIRLVVILLALTLPGTLVFFHDAGNNGQPIDIVIPNQFMGEVCLIQDTNAPDMPLFSNRYLLIIPPSGVLRVRSLHPFDQFHQQTIRFMDGRMIAQTIRSDDIPTEMAIRGVASSVNSTPSGQEHSLRFFVGTAAEYTEHLEDASRTER